MREEHQIARMVSLSFNGGNKTMKFNIKSNQE